MMQAVMFHGMREIRLENVAEPTSRDDSDAIVRISSSTA